VRHVLIDTNHWKSFVAQRLATAVGDRGALTLYGDDPERHRLLSQHMASEFRVRTEGRGRKLDEWRHRPERPDNDWWDCLVGCAVAASLQGVELKEVAAGPSPARRHTSAADYQKKREEFRARTGR
jgi:Phage terminase large subunit (GpA).